MNSSKSPIVWHTTLLLLFTFVIAVGGGVWYELAVGFRWYHWLAAGLMAGVTGISITAGYHRLWAHKTYKATPVVSLLFALFGAATYQNSILIWASQHRRHHLHVDDNESDPYSARKGFWFSHVGWLLRDYPTNHDDFSNAKDLQADPIVAWQHKYYFTIAFLMNVLPPLLLGAVTGEYLAFLLTVGIIRMVYTHHTTFFINSLAHIWGSRPYTTSNTSRDNGLLAFLTYGEGYHNFHHSFQGDYRNGVRWYQFDPTKWLIKTSSWLGLTSNLRKTPGFCIKEAQIQCQLDSADKRLALSPKIPQKWRDYIDREKAHCAQLLAEWQQTRREWLLVQKQKLNEATSDLRHTMENGALASRLKELEHALLLQYKRVQAFNQSLA